MTSERPALQLRDIHLPEPIGWWPPAPGWWLLAALALLLLTTVTLFFIFRRRTRLKRSAQAELLRIRQQYQQHSDDGLTIRQLSALLRRVCISYDRREQVASLTGSAWLHYLDQLAGEALFTNSRGQLLADAPYRQQPEACAVELLELCQRWLHQLPRRKRRQE